MEMMYFWIFIQGIKESWYIHIEKKIKVHMNLKIKTQMIKWQKKNTSVYAESKVGAEDKHKKLSKSVA